LATLLRGQVEASGGDGHEWISLTTRLVPYHPAGRRPETKVLRPEDPPQSPALPGEGELHAALAALPTHAERWARLYDRIDDAEPGHRQDPNTLGDAYNPATWLGPDASWDAIAKGTDGPLPDALRRASSATWVIVGEPIRPDLPDLGAALLDALGDRGQRWTPPPVDPDAEPLPADLIPLRDELVQRRDEALADEALALIAHLHTLAPGYGDHVVLVGIGDGMHCILEALRSSAPLRDQVQAVLGLGARIGGDPERTDARAAQACRDWLLGQFTHDHFDLEAAHQTPYISLQWLDRDCAIPGIDGLPLQSARFPTPPTVVDGRTVKHRSIEPVDLGPLPIDPELPLDRVALALWGVTTTWGVASRG
ncbi:MAG: hypothetical protein AB8H79_09280, partial [Myxococcota bacterium]